MYKYEVDRNGKFRIYNDAGRLINIVIDETVASEFVNDRNRENGSYDIGENERDEKRVRAISLGGFNTNTVKLSTGWVGQISGGPDNAVWDSEPFEDKNEAQQAANDKLKEKLKSLFA